MNPTVLTIIVALVALGAGFAVGYFLKREDLKQKTLELEAENERKIRASQEKIHKNERKAQEVLSEAKDKSHEIISEAKDKAYQKQQELEKREARLEQKENSLTEKVAELEKQRSNLEAKNQELEELREELADTIAQEKTQLEKIAKMKEKDALDLLLKKVEDTHEKDLLVKMRRAEEALQENIEEKSRNVIVQAIQKIAADTTAEATVTAVSIPNDEMKGRIIGREGRNINAFERLTGVDVIVDDTPNVITISGYDLLRRFIAKKALEKLIEDGRIHPARIEEVVQKTTEEVDKMIKEFGEKAMFETGVTGLPSELAKILGRLRFRTSYGQNVLKHAIEVAFLSEAIANEIGADPDLAKKAGLLHDIGKAVNQEVGGKHAVLGGEICRKFKLDPQLINAIESHHDDVGMDIPEAFIVAAADAISAARPGARRETVETFLKRMKELENIGSSFPGVEKCYAIQAGREIRIFVNPEKISDLDAKKLSWDIARKVEKDLAYPGEVKVLVMRETRHEEVAQ
jgi:ribonuclease Y